MNLKDDIVILNSILIAAMGDLSLVMQGIKTKDRSLAVATAMHGIGLLDAAAMMNSELAAILSKHRVAHMTDIERFMALGESFQVWMMETGRSK